MANKTIEKNIIERTISGDISSNATSIRTYAFAYCNSLTSVTLPNAETIGVSAFYSCARLTSISLPSATSIGQGAFGKCSSLTSISLPSATSIGQGAFGNCSSLTSVTLPNAETIEMSAFGSCTSLISVYLPSAEEIGDSAFTGTTEIHLYSPIETITTVGDSLKWYFHHSSSETPKNFYGGWPIKGGSKTSRTYTIYTDNATIKDACLAKADSYTTVNVYKLDGSSW